MTTSPLVTQTLICLVILGLMILSGVKKRRLELRAAPPPPRQRWREWLLQHRR